MSNAILVKKGTEYGFYIPAINPSNLIGAGLNFGLDVPKNPDGSPNLEFQKVYGEQIKKQDEVKKRNEEISKEMWERRTFEKEQRRLERDPTGWKSKRL